MSQETVRSPDFKVAALEWFRKGFPVIPILPGTKRPALTRQPWLENLSAETIAKHWNKFPNNEVAIIVPEWCIVLDADSEKAIDTMRIVEESHNVTSNLIVETKRGIHQYFNLSKGVYAPSDTFDSAKFPDRIDILGAGRQVIVPPSTGKSLKVDSIPKISDLVTVDQIFVDSIFLLNDKPAPRPPEPEKREQSKTIHSPCDSKKLEVLLGHLDPDCGYEDWTRVAMAVFHETGGSDEGLKIFNNWSFKGQKYPGYDAIKAKWRSFKSGIKNPVTIGTLIEMVTKEGVDVGEVLQQADPQFEKCKTIVVNPREEKKDEVRAPCNPLAQYSLTGRSAELEKKFKNEKAILGEIVLSGQFSVWYAAPNTGKTLIILYLIIDAIRNNKINPENIYYLNMDDTSNGLITKLKLAEEYQFNMLAPGHKNFESSVFIEAIEKIIINDQANEIIIILDTLKKFVNLMNKAESSMFAEKLRSFILKGGTIVSLAHTNKNKNGNRSKYAGTSDIVDDSDCAYIIETISENNNYGRKVIEFINIKRRGNVPNIFSYSYDNINATDYIDRILSVDIYNPEKTNLLKKEEEIRSDSEIINIIIKIIKSGTNTKMNLAIEAGKAANISRKAAINIIEKYTGNTIGEHFWNYTVQDRGRQVFHILEEG